MEDDGEWSADADRPPGRRRRFTSPEHGHTGPTRPKQFHPDEPRKKDWMHAVPVKPTRRPILPLDDQAKLAARMSEGKRHAWISEEEWEWVKAWRRAKVCMEKIPFETREAAMTEALMRQAKKPRTPDLFAYPCGVCGKYHLTKSRR